MCKSIVSECLHCGKEINSYIKNPKKYCNHSCYWSHMRDGHYKKGSSISYPCDECGSLVYGRHKAKGRNGNVSKQIFCNIECYRKNERRLIDSTRTKACKNCSIEYISYANKIVNKNNFCSMTCKTEYNRAKPKNCLNCGCLFTAVYFSDRGMKSVNSRKTCSEECNIERIKTNQERKDKISKAFSGDKHPNWHGGSGYSGFRGAGWKKIAEKCRDIHNRKCKHCGMDETESIVLGWGKLQVNHIIPFHQSKNKTLANKQSNLEALCKSCHTKADAKWKKENPTQFVLDIFN